MKGVFLNRLYKIEAVLFIFICFFKLFRRLQRWNDAISSTKHTAVRSSRSIKTWEIFRSATFWSMRMYLSFGWILAALFDSSPDSSMKSYSSSRSSSSRLRLFKASVVSTEEDLYVLRKSSNFAVQWSARAHEAVNYGGKRYPEKQRNSQAPEVIAYEPYLRIGIGERWRESKLSKEG